MKDGQYGTPLRQRYRCLGRVVNPATGEVREFHRFVPVTPRIYVESATCDTCDNHIAPHDGPVVTRHYQFPMREVASAFVAVGSGSSYMRAARRARVGAERLEVADEPGGALVAEWLDSYGPALLQQYAETTWPETLVLDSTRFMHTNPWNGQRGLAFNVLGAYGYPSQGPARVWALRASHRATEFDWIDFLRELDVTAPPRLVITDGGPEAGNAVRKVWPALPSPSFPVPFVKRCEYHLRQNALEAMEGDRIGGWKHWMRVRLDTAFRRSEGWEEFVEKSNGFLNLTTWLNGIEADVELQVNVRHLLPAHHSTAALDQHLGTVRDFLDSRSFVLRSQDRLNVTLGLMRLHLNHQDVERQYRVHLRDIVNSTGGAPRSQRAGYYPRTLPNGDPHPGTLRL